MRRRIITALALPALVLCLTPAVRGEVTAAQVNKAIADGVAFLERQQGPNGGWPEHGSDPGGGLSALCTLALLNSGRTKDDPSVKNALVYLERLKSPDRIYSVSLMLMAFAQADPKRYALKISGLAKWIEAKQVSRNDRFKGGWRYTSPNEQSDNSSTQFAILALHEAERAGVKIPDQTWQLAYNYWTQPGMQRADGGFGYQVGDSPSGSMTCAGIASLLMCRDRLAMGDAQVEGGRVQCCGNQTPNDPVENGLNWLGKHFSVTRNPGNDPNWTLYYLYALERVGRMSGQRLIGTHDWYREGCEHLLAHQDDLNHRWTGQGAGENDPLVGTALALLFLSKGRRPIVIAKVQHQPDVAGQAALDWDHHRRAVQNLTMRVERQWQRDLSWQTISYTGKEAVPVTTAELLESPVLFFSGSESLRLDANRKRLLKEYIENGGFIFAEACSGNGCNGAAFDHDFRALMRELFPDSELRRLPPDHAVWYAQEKVSPQDLPKDPEFWLWGLDACCRTSVIYCPRTLSCYWELAHPYHESNFPPAVKSEIEAVTRLGGNVLAYATSRELKEKLDRPQVAVSARGGRSPRGALVVPKLSHGGGSDDAPAALANLLTIVERQLEMQVDHEKRLLAPTDEKLLDYPLVFMHGRRAFRFSAAERKALKDYLDRGGFLFADAICANQQFADALRQELKLIYPDAQFTRLPASHPLFTTEFHGFPLPSVTLRDPQIRTEGDPLTAKLVKAAPLLESLEVGGRIAVILSPYDLSCALEKGASLDCKGYIPADAARIGVNVLLYALSQ
jgi:hypothetical protein